MMKRMRKLRAVRNPKSNYEPNSSTNNQSTEGRHSRHPRLELQLTYLTVARNQIRTRGSSITTGGNKDTYGFCIQHS